MRRILPNAAPINCATLTIDEHSEDTIGIRKRQARQKSKYHTPKHKQTPRIERGVYPCGGAKGVRTPDLDTASVALSQLSYGPMKCTFGGGEGARTPDLDSAIVALSQLSYTPARTRGV